MNNISYLHLGLNKINFFKILAYVMVVIVVNGSLSFNLLPLGSFYYVIFICALFLLLLNVATEKKKFNLNMILLIIVIFLSIIFNDIPSVFKSYERFFMFLVIILTIGPLMASKKLIYFRSILFDFFIKLNVFICALSFLGLATGIYKGILVSHFGGLRVDFTGLYNHSMLLGPLSAIATISCMYFGFICKTNKKRKILFFIGLLCFLSCISAGSRGALVALIISSIFFINKIYQGKKSKVISTILFILIVLVGTFPLWEKHSDFLMSKGQLGDKEVFASRTTKWEQRIVEFKSSPIFGIGFASISIDGNDNFNEKTGSIEPGSSWLAVLSMTGLVGFVFLSSLTIRMLYPAIKAKKDIQKWSFLGAILIIFIIHFFSEGYVFASGNFLFFVFWLLLGVIEGEKILNRQ